jgi:acyl-CoA synthetase (NDP forming)
MPAAPRAPIRASLDALFRPRSVVFLGATPDLNKLGGRTFWNLKEKFKGTIYPINPRYQDVMGVPALPSIEALPEAPELAIVLVPAEKLVPEMEALAAKGTKAACIITSGFAEMGEGGAAAQARIAEIAKASGMRVLGPNCMGFFNVPDGVYSTFSTAFRVAWPKLGGLGIASQSGAVGGHLFALGRERGLGFSHWITMGNQCDVDFADTVEFLVEDKATTVIMGYLEGATDGARLREVLEQARLARKPVVMMKVGRSAQGAEAAQSHTASLVGSDAVYDAVFREAGVHRAETMEELVDVAEACTLGRRPANRRLGIVTVSGGAGILMADAAAEAGLELPELPAAAQAKVKAVVPYAGTRNPLDTTALAVTDFGFLRTCIDLMLQDGGCSALAIFVSALGLNPEMTAKMMAALEGFSGDAAAGVIAFSIVARPEVRASLREAGFVVCEDPDRTVKVIAALARLEEAFARPAAAKETKIKPARLPAGALDEHISKRLLAEAGVPVAEERLAGSAKEAVTAAKALGLPVVMKIASPDIAHKSEIGGVLLNVATERAVEAGYVTLVDHAREKAPGAKLSGVLVAPMIRGGVETILGVRNDPVFGPTVMFGLGGVFVEIMNDVSIRLAPVNSAQARAMVREVKGYPLLAGARGKARMDEAALAAAIEALSRFAVAHAAEIDSIDVNPFIVMEKGAVAVDAWVARKG